MTEAEWLAATDPTRMLKFLRDSGKLSGRKARLFAVACCRRISHLAGLPEVAVSERAADGLATEDELAEARAESARGYEQSVGQFSYTPPPEYILAFGAALAATSSPATDAAEAASRGAATFAGDEELPAQAALLPDLFGPLPFRPVAVENGWLTWNDGTVRRLTEAAYQERLLPQGTLDPGRLAVLADALEESGCNNEEILSHLRQQGVTHVRGCWVLDLLLNKE
jgi:hypothetical protein